MLLDLFLEVTHSAAEESVSGFAFPALHAVHAFHLQTQLVIVERAVMLHACRLAFLRRADRRSLFLLKTPTERS